MSSDRPDWDAEGLLEGLDGEALEARRRLLDSLHDDGVSTEELSEAVAEDRLVLVPAERALSGQPEWTAAELAEEVGVDEELVPRLVRALGLPDPGEGEKVADEGAKHAMESLKVFLDAGVEPERIVEVARVIGRLGADLAEAILQVGAAHLLNPGDTEEELGRRLADAVDQLMPQWEPLGEFILRYHLRERLSQVVLSEDEREGGEIAGAEEMTVAFIDLQGFTRLGERLDALDLGRLAGRLEELAADAAEPPVRLVKTLGDGVLLSSPSTPEILRAVLGLVAEVEADEDIPPVTGGVARGRVQRRGGDLYGRAVNLASRASDAARPDKVLVAKEVMDDVDAEEEGLRFSRGRPRNLKGFRGTTMLHKVELLEDDEDDDDED